MVTFSCSSRRRRTGGLSSEAGWTFVETIIVIGIILILTSTVGFMAFRYIDKAKVVSAKSQIENLVMALNTYYMDCKQYPTEQQGLDALWEKPVLEPVPEEWKGPYLDKKLTSDPWGHVYKYSVPGPNGLPFGILSEGQGANQEISSWQN